MYCAGGQSYCVGLWAGHRYKQPALQAAHASWSLGATVGPFIIGQFLVELPQTNAVRVDNRTLTPSVFETAEVTALVKNYSGYVGMLVTYILQSSKVSISILIWSKVEQKSLNV